TSYITDAKGNVNQYDAYLPYGELLVDEHSSSEDMPYKFNGKEFDEETGLYYYGARYMDPVISMWYGVDKLAEAYTNIGNYVYCHDQPLSRIDIGGNWDVKVSASSNRGAHPYAIYTVSDRKGNVIYETVVKVLGNSRIRNAPKADTPQGRYKILGWRKTGKGTRYNTTSFGVNDLLALEYQGGEGGNRQGMHTHGGRPRKDRLVGTHGCIRMADDDIKELKEIVTNLENYDPKEKKGFLTVTDDLKTPVNYSQREEIKQRRNIGYTLDEVVVVGKRPEKAINNPNKDNHKTQRR
ncbi:MAG: RHS repeat-associated core domain-containing protein, partial [Prevotella sp.]|nr:RHS repeat-associated core domain-containing protein [Prevotella sp.]